MYSKRFTRSSAWAIGVTLVVMAGVWGVLPPRMECPDPPSSALADLVEKAPAVQLWAAPIDFLGGRAIHPHFLYVQPGDVGVHRVEVWYQPGPTGRHVWVDQITPLQDQNEGLCLLGERRGPDAKSVIDTLRAAPEIYTWAEWYFPFPGPNSNTFAAMILRQSGWSVSLPTQAIGRRFAVSRDAID